MSNGNTSSTASKGSSPAGGSSVGVVKVVAAVVGVVVVALLGVVAYMYFGTPYSAPEDVRVTNVTDRSATVSWKTADATPGVVVYSEDESFYPWLLAKMGKEKAYDDRDVSAAELAAAQELADEAADSGEVSDLQVVEDVTVSDKGDYYTHHVTIKGLEPEKTYYFMVGNGVRFTAGTFAENFTASSDGSVTTLAELEDILVPNPTYGNVVSTETAIDDGVAYMKVDPDSDYGPLSAALNENGKWYIDISNARDSEGKPVEDLDESTDSELIYVEAGQYGQSEMIEVPMSLDAPAADVEVSVSSEGNETSRLISKVAAADCTQQSPGAYCLTVGKDNEGCCLLAGDNCDTVIWNPGDPNCTSVHEAFEGSSDAGQEPSSGAGVDSAGNASCPSGSSNGVDHGKLGSATYYGDDDEPCTVTDAEGNVISRNSTCDWFRCNNGNWVDVDNVSNYSNLEDTSVSECQAINSQTFEGGKAKKIYSCNHTAGCEWYMCDDKCDTAGLGLCDDICCKKPNGNHVFVEWSVCEYSYGGERIQDTSSCEIVTCIVDGRRLRMSRTECSDSEGEIEVGQPGPMSSPPVDDNEIPLEPEDSDVVNQTRCCVDTDGKLHSEDKFDCETGCGDDTVPNRPCTYVPCARSNAEESGDDVYDRPQGDEEMNLAPSVSAQSDEYTITDEYVIKPSGDGVYDIEIAGKGSAMSVRMLEGESYTFYVDTNGNGDHDTDEETVEVDENSVTMSADANKDVFDISLEPGFNFVSFEYMPSETDSCDIIVDMNEQSTQLITQLARFESGAFQVTSYRDDIEGDQAGGECFPVVPGRGYVIRAFENESLNLDGYSLNEAADVSFDTAGWHLIGVNGASTVYTAESLLDAIDEVEGLDADNVTQWEADKSKYEGLQKEEDDSGEMQVYGFDFPINDGQGYFVRVADGAGVWSP